STVQDLTAQEIMVKDLAEQDLTNTKNNLIKTAQDLIKSVAASGDSVGGSVECVCQGLPAGKIGDALFEGLEGKISYS
ncbi:MAG: chorismate synthase, partial [Clostridia bacterium]